MRTDWTQQIGMYAGYLVFAPIYIGTSLHEASWRDQGNFSNGAGWEGAGPGSYANAASYTATPIMPQVVIPLRIKTMDEPIRQPKTTEISTIPTVDYTNWSDGTAAAIFYGAADPLQTNIEGTFLSPTITVTDALHPLLTYAQVQPTATPVTDYRNPPVVIPFDGKTRHPDYPLVLPDLTAISYGDLIWMYLEGRFVRTSPSAYQRVDPSAYIDPFGNYYPNPVINQYTCTKQAGNIAREQFTLQMWLER